MLTILDIQGQGLASCYISDTGNLA